MTDDERERLRHPAVGAVILFTRNYDNPEQLRALTEDIERLREPALPVCVDHEGGRVQRFREGFTTIPPMRALGKLWDRDRDAAREAATSIGYIVASELGAHGVDFSFAPVLDLDYGGSSVIGDRALHFDPTAVGALGACLVRGFAQGGVAAVAKHFPGHGYAEADSHVAVPGGPPERARAAIGAGCDMVLLCNNPKGLDELLESLQDVQLSKPERLERMRRQGGRDLRKSVAYREALGELQKLV